MTDYLFVSYAVPRNADPGQCHAAEAEARAAGWSLVPEWPQLGFQIVDDQTDHVYDSFADMVAEVEADDLPDPDDWHWFHFDGQIKYEPSRQLLWGLTGRGPGIGANMDDIEARWHVVTLQLVNAGLLPATKPEHP